MFYEPTEAADVENVLKDYGKEIQQSVSGILLFTARHSYSIKRVSRKCNGALLMAVVGAKLSEGLNFADNLARAVIMVGLPYPNANSPELKERLKYTSNTSKRKGKGEDAGRELYESLCMNAVNQSIGKRFSAQQAVAYSLHRKVVQLGTRKTGRAWF